MISADVNYYAINPWQNPFAVVGNRNLDNLPSTVSVASDPDPDDEGVDYKCPPAFAKYGIQQEVVRVCDDHVVIDDTLQILRVPYFEDKMAGNLPSFWGFVPRWYIPHVALQFEDYEYPVTLTLMIVDSVKENYVSIGWDWPPIRIDKGGLLVQELVLEYIESSVGSAVTLPLDFSGFFGDKALVKLLSLMVLEVDGVYVDFETRELCFNDGADTVPLTFLGLTDEDYIIDIELTVQ